MDQERFDLCQCGHIRGDHEGSAPQPCLVGKDDDDKAPRCACRGFRAAASISAMSPLAIDMAIERGDLPRRTRAGALHGMAMLARGECDAELDAPEWAPSLAELQERVQGVANAKAAAMELACSLVSALDYTADDCRIEHHIADLQSAEGQRDVLVVLGKPVFEVVTKMVGMVVTVAPRVIAWPEAKP